MDKITINLDVEDGKVKGMEILKNGMDRTEYLDPCFGEEMSIEDVLFEIRDYIKECRKGENQ